MGEKEALDKTAKGLSRTSNPKTPSFLEKIGVFATYLKYIVIFTKIFHFITVFSQVFRVLFALKSSDFWIEKNNTQQAKTATKKIKNYCVFE